MALAPNTQLGPYKILSTLGAGGMGEVYRATDTRLDRTVAIKVLPAHLAHNGELRQRFEREARAISSLAHPHICTLYDVGQQDGIAYLVMESLEGESLAERLAKVALPLEQTLRYATQIAEALAKAHRAGIVHRDLKPGNVRLTKSGAKLLDFELAKLAGTRSDERGARNEEAETLIQDADEFHRSSFRDPTLTAAGTILGTFQYMGTACK
jgi:serine/threonine protein kinase